MLAFYLWHRKLRVMTVWVIALKSPPFWLKLYRTTTKKHFLSFREAAFEGSISGGRGDNWDDKVQPFYFAPCMHEKFEDSISMVSHTSTLSFLGPGAALLPEHWNSREHCPQTAPYRSDLLPTAALSCANTIKQLPWDNGPLLRSLQQGELWVHRNLSLSWSVSILSWEPAKPTGHSPHVLSSVDISHWSPDARNPCEHMIIYVLCVNRKSVISGSCNLEQHTFSNTY